MRRATAQAAPERARRRGSVRCVGCNRPVGLVWFGAGPELVEITPVVLPEGGAALVIHRCPDQEGRRLGREEGR